MRHSDTERLAFRLFVNDCQALVGADGVVSPLVFAVGTLTLIEHYLIRHAPETDVTPLFQSPIAAIYFGGQFPGEAVRQSLETHGLLVPTDRGLELWDWEKRRPNFLKASAGRRNAKEGGERAGDADEANETPSLRLPLSAAPTPPSPPPVVDEDVRRGLAQRLAEAGVADTGVLAAAFANGATPADVHSLIDAFLALKPKKSPGFLHWRLKNFDRFVEAAQTLPAVIPKRKLTDDLVMRMRFTLVRAGVHEARDAPPERLLALYQGKESQHESLSPPLPVEHTGPRAD